MTYNDTQTGLAARLLRGAKDLVWQDQPVPARAAAAPQEPVAAPTPASPANPMTTQLMALVMNRPTAYSALAEAVAALADIPMDEATRYRSSFAVLKKTQQRTVEQLNQAIDVHLSVLESEQARFAGQSSSTEEAEVVSRLSEVATLDQAVDADVRAIEKLRTDTETLVRQIEQDIAEKKARSAELLRETEQKKQAMAQTVRDFQAASENVRSTLLGAKSKVQQYLGQS